MDLVVSDYLGLSSDLIERAARHLGWRVIRRLHATITIRTRQGTFMIDTKDCGIGQRLYTHREYEYASSMKAVQFLIERRLIPSDRATMVDIGANVGIISIGLLKAGLIQQAIAIEPEPHNFRLLDVNISLNGLSDKMKALNIAVGASRATMQMELSGLNHGDHRIRAEQPKIASEAYAESKWPVAEVECFPLDQVADLLREEPRDVGWPPSMMWIDIQGYEGFAFLGANRLLATGLPTVSEIWPYGILRSGMEINEFVSILRRYWTHYWVDRRGKFVRYPLEVMNCFIDELYLHNYENVIFTREGTPT